MVILPIEQFKLDLNSMKACKFGSNEMDFEVYESKFRVRGSASQKHDSGQFDIKTFANNSGELADEYKKK